MMTFSNRLQFAKKTLQILNSKTMHRSDWTILCISEIKCSPMQFERMLEFLIAQQYVERVKRGVYRITVKGKAFANI